jgi:hypothetical protein
MPAVVAMASRREGHFVFTVSSDGCLDVYPENKPQDFKISLKEPLEFDSEDTWEVGVLDFLYPLSWVNIGGKTGARMFYYSGGEVRELRFPEWHCRDMEELTKYMHGELSPNFEVRADALGRFVIKSKGLWCEIGMNEEMMKILGLDGLGESLKNVISEESLRKRAVLKQSMMRFWKSGNPLETDEALIEEISESSGKYQAFASLLKEYLAVEKLAVTKLSVPGLLESKEGVEISRQIGSIAQSLGLQTVPHKELANNFAFLYQQIISFCEVEKPPKQIVAVTKGSLTTNFEQMFIHSNIIEPVDVNDGVSDVLRVVKSREDRGRRTTQEIFSRPTYHPVKKGGKISLIHVNIRGRNGELVPFSGGTVLLTLQFRQRRV